MTVKTIGRDKVRGASNTDTERGQKGCEICLNATMLSA